MRGVQNERIVVTLLAAATLLLTTGSATRRVAMAILQLKADGGKLIGAMRGDQALLPREVLREPRRTKGRRITEVHLTK